MIAFEDALALTAQHALALPSEMIDLDKAVGRRTSAPVVASLSRPARDVSAMDGWAVGPVKIGDRLTPIGTSRAGYLFDGAIGVGQTVRVFTGATLPDGTHRVIPQEFAIDEGDGVLIARVPEVTFVRHEGSDHTVGDRLLQSGVHLTPAHILMLAAANISQLEVAAQPRIAVLCSGDELVQLGQTPNPAQAIDANGPGLTALLQNWRCGVVSCETVADDADDIASAIARVAPRCDIVLSVGGASVGTHDLMQSTFTQVGYASVFSKVALRPGKPVWLSHRDKSLVLGLPGNPTSAWVCAHVFLQILIGRPLAFQSHLMAQNLPSGGDRSEFVRGVLRDGRIHVFEDQDSALTSVMSAATVLVHRPAGCPASPIGTIVPVLNI